MDTDSLYLVSAEKNMEDCILPEKKANGYKFNKISKYRTWCTVHKKTITENQDYPKKIFAGLKYLFCAVLKKIQDKREPGLFKVELCCAARRSAAMTVRLSKSNLVAEESTNEH